MQVLESLQPSILYSRLVSSPWVDSRYLILHSLINADDSKSLTVFLFLEVILEICSMISSIVLIWRLRIP